LSDLPETCGDYVFEVNRIVSSASLVKRTGPMTLALTLIFALNLYRNLSRARA